MLGEKLSGSSRENVPIYVYLLIICLPQAQILITDKETTSFMQY